MECGPRGRHRSGKVEVLPVHGQALVIPSTPTITFVNLEFARCQLPTLGNTPAHLGFLSFAAGAGQSTANSSHCL